MKRTVIAIAAAAVLSTITLAGFSTGLGCLDGVCAHKPNPVQCLDGVCATPSALKCLDGVCSTK